MSNDYKKSDMMDMVEMYVLGGLDREEQEQFEAYMRQDEDCRAAVEELQDIIGFLPLTSEVVEPPQGMRNRVLEHVFSSSETGSTVDKVVPLAPRNAEPGTVSTSPAAVQQAAQSAEVGSAEKYNSSASSNTRRRKGIFWRVAAIVVAASIISVYAANMEGQIRDLQQQLAIANSQKNSLQGQLATVSMPTQGARVDEAVQLSPAAKDIVAQGLATIVIDDKGTHLLVQADNLPKLQGKEAFQVWLIKGDVKQSAGTFWASDGKGAMYYTFKPEGYDTVAITLEPDEKGSQPRGPVILAASIQGQG
ncbi:anti-sigma factor [Paenibacillus dauci]|uniref:anti-sigma factor n=1 Tax=Paenibacillus dauci TaxID=1567106 RepID=UPI000619B296|nr:anti-sigma factor [Paenibacillus dauci]